MREDARLLSTRQRRFAWAGFGLTAAYAPVVAYLSADGSWLLNVVVAGIVGTLILADDASRQPQQAGADQ